MGSREGDVTRRVHGLRNALEMVPKNDVEVAAPCRNEPRPCLRTASCCHVMYTGDTGMVFECTDDLGEVSCFFLVFFFVGRGKSSAVQISAKKAAAPWSKHEPELRYRWLVQSSYVPNLFLPQLAQCSGDLGPRAAGNPARRVDLVEPLHWVFGVKPQLSLRKRLVFQPVATSGTC